MINPPGTKKIGLINKDEADAIIAEKVEEYLIANPPVGGLTIDQIKADTQINASIDHSQTAHLAFSGMAKITVGTTEPANPGIGDLWIDSN